MALLRWKTLRSDYLVRDRWLSLRADRCETASGVIVDPYYVQELADWVQIAAFDELGRILITRQYRHGAGVIGRELPCGTVEPGETPAEAMRRELLEETGCAITELRALPILSPNPARCTNRVHGFVGIGAKRIGAPAVDATEEIEFEFLAVPRVLEMIEAGEFQQALHVATLLWALHAHAAYDRAEPAPSDD